MNFNFPPKKGSGIEKMLPHCSQDCVDLIYQMCAYDPDERITAKQGLRHPYFKELRSVKVEPFDPLTAGVAYIRVFIFY